MSASPLNTAAPALPGAAPTGAAAAGGANAAGQAGNPLAGFDALLAALFPQADIAGVAAARDGKAGAGDSLTAGDPAAVTDGKAGGKPGEKDDAVDGDDTALLADASVLIADPDTGLAACQGATTPRLIDALQITAKNPAAAEHGPRAKPLVPVLGRGEAQPPPGKSGLAPDAAPEGGDLTDPLLAASQPETIELAKADKPAPPAWGRDKAPGAPATPALANANPHADLAEKAAPATAKAEPPPADLPPAEAAPAIETPPVVEATLPVVAGDKLVRRDAPITKPSRSERGKAGETAAVSDLKAPDPAAKPITAHAVTGAAKSAAAQADAPNTDAAAPAAKATSDSADGSGPADTHAAPAQSTAPTAHAAHAVRGAPETVANLAAQIVKKLESKSTRFDLELDPAGLGKVNVRVEIGAHGALTAAMSFDNPQAAAELKSRAAELTRALEQAGFDLSGGLSFDVADQRGQHQQQHQAWQDGGDNRAFRGQAFRAALDTADDAAQAAANGALRLRRGVSAGVDVRI
jgi:flagellar hook-length control protein FliK